MEHRREIDGLRALAVVPVILFHAGVSGFSGGFVGVDIFFVISGYLITSIIINDLALGRFSLVTFYERRARRILPALYLVIGLCIPLAWFLLLPRDMVDFSRSVAAVALFVSNILFWRETGYFDVAAELKPLLHTWSLSVEEQYYLLFPLVLVALWRHRPRWTTRAVWLGFALSLALAHWAAAHKPVAAFFLLPTRAWELAVGALLALHPRPSEPRPAFALGGMLLIACSVVAFDQTTPFPGLHALVPTVGAALLILHAHPGTLTGSVLGSRLLVGVGLISYSAYLWHQPLLAFARLYNFRAPPPLVVAALLGATFALAYLSWRFVERPFRNPQSISRSSVFAFGGLGLLALLGFGMAGSATDGFHAARTTVAQRQVLATATVSPKRAECHTQGQEYLRPARGCVYHGPNARWAVVGDSHAVELAYALAERLAPEDDGVLHLSFSSCGPAYRGASPTPGCVAWTGEAVDEIVRRRGVTDVVVAYRLNAALFGRHELSYPALPNAVSAREREQAWSSLKAMLEVFVRAGRKVTLVLQAPEVPMPTPGLVMRNRHHPGDIVGIDLGWWSDRAAFVASRLRELPPEVRIVDPARLVCGERQCHAVRDGVALYFDDHHLSLAGARLVADEVIARARGNGPGRTAP
jgi:peptidoglycan/LPS O-acetylase OafA/YrhL